MPHLSENSRKLKCIRHVKYSLNALENVKTDDPEVYLLRLPPNHWFVDSRQSRSAYRRIADFCARLNGQSTACILASPADAAQLLPYLESSLRFQMWIAIKTKISESQAAEGQLKSRHIALLVLTRYKKALQHTKTRIKYSYCPACGKTTKDYGGKKHVYHEYGTLISDVWRDIEIDPDRDINVVEERLSDLFGIEIYKSLEVFDLRKCPDLVHPSKREVREQRSGLQQVLFSDIASVKHTECKLMNADCIDALKALPSNSVDFCFADPPYNLEKKYEGYNDSIESKDYFVWCDQWLAELARVLKTGRTCAVLNIPLWAVRHFQFLSSILEFQGWIAWDAMGFPVRLIMPSHYAILCFSKGKPRPLPGLNAHPKSALESECLMPLAEFFCNRSACIASRNQTRITDRGQLTDLWYDIHRLKHNSRRVDHPCQLPPLLMRRLIALFTRPDEVVLDCFNGVGTTTLSAQQLGRKYIGIELSPKYHAIAVQRHNDLDVGKDPFAKKAAVPSAKNSPVPRLLKQVYKVSKKTLQMDVKRIAQQIGRIPNREEVNALSRFPIEYFDNYFISWGEVCAAARTTGMSELPPEKRDHMFELPFPTKT